jgi:predicted DsbA family dithiol-disulfide isomerase
MALHAPGLIESAVAIGLDKERSTECFESGATAASVQRAREQGVQLGVSGTPAFFVGVETV